MDPGLVDAKLACPHCGAAIGAADAPLPGVSPIPAVGPAQMRFTFGCQRCGSVLEAFSDLCGRSGRCPTCGAVFTVPSVDARTGLAIGPASVADDGSLPTPVHAYATAGAKAPQIKRLASGEQVIVCPRCAREMPIDADSCKTCGIPFTIEGAEAIRRETPTSNTWATASLTVGVLSLPGACIPGAGLVAVGLGLQALAVSRRMGRHEGGRGMAWTGIVCGGISTVIGALLFLV